MDQKPIIVASTPNRSGPDWVEERFIGGGGPVGEDAFKAQFLTNPEWSLEEKFQAHWTDTGRYKK